MTAVARNADPTVAPQPVSRRRRIASTARVERRKLLAQLPLRVLAGVSVVGPVAFAILLKVQSGAPSDALFGVWVHSSGFAVSLVVLGFAGNWGFPIIAGVLAGDLFASEDRHGTWKTILGRSRTLGELFAGKVLAALQFALLIGALLAIASVVAGLLVFGAHPMVDLAGRELSPLHLVLLAVASWVIVQLPLLAYTCLAVLFSVATRNGIVGVLGPVLVALLSQLLALIGNGVWLHLLLISSGFDAWHGLFAARPYFGPLAVAVLVCLAWMAATSWAAWLILRRRELGVLGAQGRRGWQASLRFAVAGTALFAILALATNLGPAGVTARRLSRTLSPEFRRLTVLQQNLLGHPIPAGARYRILPVCGRRSAAPVGPGDWSCTMNVYILLPGGNQPLTDTPISYDVSVQSNGCFKAQSPPLLVGQAVIHDQQGRTVINPIATIYGCFNTL